MQECYHCGSNCEEEIYFDEKIFCCEGCKTVYDILSGSDLTNYYKIEQTVGDVSTSKIGVKANKSFKGKYNFLDLPEFREKLITFSEGDYSKITLFLPQIHCSSCLWLLERLDKLADGVTSSQIFFAKKEAEITFNESKISLRELAELLASIGYPPSITLEDYDKKKSSKSNKKLLFKIGLVGFCFGNVMLMSFPEYFGIDEQYKSFQNTFNYINFALSIPVLIFGAKDYIVSAYKSLKNKRINIDVPISIGILALYLRSLYEVTFGVGAGYFDSFIGLIFFLLIGKWFQNQTYTAINFERDYKSYFPIAVSRLKNDNEEIVALKKVKVGDKLIIRNNELIPTDSILLKGKGSIDYSFVTGESVPIEKNSGDKLYAGGKQKGESIEVEVIKNIDNSYLTQLWNNPIFDKKNEYETLSDKISRKFTVGLLIVAFIAGLAWLYVDASRASFIVVSILIVACPCAIALSVPFTYGNGIRVLGRKGFYLRSVNVIEPMTEITDLVFDKTGTLTHNNQSKIKWEGQTLSNEDLAVIQQATYHSSHPLSRQISSHIEKAPKTIKFDEFDEIPSKGIKVVFSSNEYKIGHKNWIGARAYDNKTRVYIAKNNLVLGAFVFENIYRSGLEVLFEKLNPNYKIHILSGDNDSEKEKLFQMLPKNSNLIFNQKPEDKLNYIKILQEQNKKVMMLGDGLNDAGALQQSNVGVSVVDDVYSFTPSSDVIINGEKLINLSDYLKYAKFNTKVVKWSYVFSLLYNLVGLSFAITGHLQPLVAAILMPLSSISVVLLVTLATSLKGRKLC
ncbi:MAG TPA: HAD family hydrolase [Crocinitomix sp.]|nr:HAD family hydrolase [Crocinitomix sp.]